MHSCVYKYWNPLNYYCCRIVPEAHLQLCSAGTLVKENNRLCEQRLLIKSVELKIDTNIKLYDCIHFSEISKLQQKVGSNM